MRIAVMTPTYNERDNIDEFVRRTRTAVPHAHIFVVDDASPDGTGARVSELASSDPLISLVSRNGPRGYAAASRDGLAHLAALGYEAVVTIDCDLSHDPSDIPTMLQRLARDADVVIGSRYVPGGGVRNWPLSRRLLSRWGNRYTDMMLGLGVRDCTSGFRAYRSEVLHSGVFAETTSDGYAFLTDVLFRLHKKNHWRIVEVPITLTQRTAGESKMNKTIIIESMRRVTLWGLQRLAR